MSRSINKIFLLGNVGADPEKIENSAHLIVRCSLATNSRKRKGDEYVDVTEWHRLTFFGDLARVVQQYVKKGSKIHVEGRMHYSSTEDQLSGRRQYWSEVIVRELVMLDPPPAGQKGPPPPFEADEDDLPF